MNISSKSKNKKTQKENDENKEKSNYMLDNIYSIAIDFG